MAVTADGEIAGSVSGGCVEAAVVDAALEVLEGGKPRLLHFRVTDEQSLAVGLACGGEMDVFVRRLSRSFYHVLRQELASAAEVTHLLVTGPSGSDWYGAELLFRGDTCLWSERPAVESIAVSHLARRQLGEAPSRRLTLRIDGQELEVFAEQLAAPPTLVCVGGVHIAVALTAIAKALGYVTVVIDPRRLFGSPERFSHVDRLIQEWPEEAFQQLTITGNTAVAVLTHDPKIDEIALKVALASPAFYVGCLGRSTTQASRREALLEAGVTPEELLRIHGPIGLDLGGRAPEEIALSIMAEVVAVRYGRSFPRGEAVASPVAAVSRCCAAKA